MAFRLDSILNPSSPAPERNDPPAQVATTFDAAAALTALSTVAPAYPPTFSHDDQPGASQRPLHSPTNSTGGGGRPNSSYSNHAIPVEPSPPLESYSPPVSAGLQQYHHGSKSPEEQRRESFAHPPDYATQLAPISSLAQDDESPAGAVGAPRQRSGASRADADIVSTDTSSKTQLRDSSILRDDPASSHLRVLSSAKPDSALDQLRPAERHPSATPKITDELALSPSARAPTSASTTSPPPLPKEDATTGVDLDTARAIAAAANEHGTRGVRTKPTVEQPSDLGPAGPPPPQKKMPTAKVGTKKGVARKPSQKKRRIDDDEERRSTSPAALASKPVTTARGVPTKNRGSNSNTPQPASSPTPASQTASTPREGDDDVDDGSDTELYCICRKPDNHSWMIACDGGCDDWFHGKCVKMKEEEGELIDKYICPNCEGVGKGVTTWKPGCRRDGCNKPALIRKDKQSKYCSEECGKEFMREMLKLDSERPSKKQKRKPGGHADQAGGVDLDEEEDIGPRGGVLRPGDVKAMLNASKNAEEFRALGDGVLSPPATASPEKTTFEYSEPANGTETDNPPSTSLASAPPPPQPPSYTLTPAEARRIQDIADAQDRLSAKKMLLRDRERFIKMVVEQANRHAEKQGVKPKDVCGYDSRLAWSDREFQAWRESRSGKEALRSGTLEVQAEADADAAPPQTNGVTPEVGSGGADGDTEMRDADTGLDNGAGEQDRGEEPRICVKKRCEQHRQWQKNEMTGVRAELVDVGEDTAGLVREEREVREQAFRRWKGEQGSNETGTAAGGVGGVAEQQSSEGWVEVVV